MPLFDRRALAAGGLTSLAAVLAGCAGETRTLPVGGDLLGGLFGGASGRDGDTLSTPDYAAIYGAYRGEQFPIDAFDYHAVNPRYLRQEVVYPGPEPAGSIVVDPHAKFLYFIEPGSRATRYGVGVGREGFAWSGRAQINMKRNWPDWVPPAEMVARLPDISSQLVKTSRGLGVPGGPRSPLGARAMYLFRDGRDLGYRIHGTLEPETIGSEVSSGCIRLVNQDVVHLYARTPVGTKVVVLG
jgi:lipoprotein-anchoring transpeptidase ErfK/SrfK